MTSLPPELRIAIESIDRGHFDLVTTLDRLIVAHGCDKQSKRLSEVMNQLGEQLVRHFDTEEHFLRSCALPREDIDAHIQEHNEILDQYVQLSDDHLERKARSERAQLIKELVLRHLLEHDIKIQSNVTVGPIGHSPRLFSTRRSITDSL